MINSQGLFDWATYIPSPPNKYYPETNKLQGVVFHSAVGTLQGVTNRVLDPSIQISVTGCISYSGRLVQYYPITSSCWANGSHTTNVNYLGFEHEGGLPGNESEPLTEQQIQADMRILIDLAEYKGVDLDFWQRPTTLIEHKEIYATACPSNRIPWGEIARRLMSDQRTWVYGNEQAGLEVKGNQLLEWHNGIIINMIGSEDGQFPGKRLHNEGGTFIEVEP